MVVFRAGAFGGRGALVHDPLCAVPILGVGPVTEAVLKGTRGNLGASSVEHHHVVQRYDAVAAFLALQRPKGQLGGRESSY